MPIRKTPLVINHYYHLYNRSVAKVPIFRTKKDYVRTTEVLNYYRFDNLSYSYSALKKLSKERQKIILKTLKEKNKKLVEIVCFCLMPNHFHFLLKQKQEKGIMIFIRNFQNSYAKYFNIKYQRTGSLFQNSFKAVLIEDDNQLLHLSRYIHLNPYSSLIIGKKKDLLGYSWSSFPQFLGKKKGFCQPKIILDKFNSIKDYEKFVLDRADYQKSLEEIKHLIHE